MELCLLPFFLPKRWKWKIDKHTPGQRALAVDVITDLGRLSIVGVHLTPVGWGREGRAHNDRAWHSDLDSLQHLVAGRPGRLVLAGDFNARIGVRRQRHRAGGRGGRDARGDRLWVWLSAVGLTAAHLGFPAGNTYSRRGRMDRRRVAALLDFIFLRARQGDEVTIFSS